MPDDSRPPMAKPAAALAHDHTPHLRARPPRRLKGAAVTLVIAAAVAAAYGIWSRDNKTAELTQWTDAQAVPSVRLVRPTADLAPRALTLPGDVEAFYEAPIYARVSGYIRDWRVDIGAPVTKGQVLASIDTPDLDQRLAQAQADLASARADEALADLTAARWHALLATNSVSVQSADEKRGAADASRATVRAQQAHVDQLAALEGFKHLTAPFDGVVTARNTDIGALINAGSSASTPLFKVADVHEMRVYVHVPQALAGDLTKGMAATLAEPQYPGETFPATLVTTSEAVSAASRTLLVELRAANDGKLWPGSFAQVTIHLPADHAMLTVPSSALIFRARGAQLAMVGPDHRIQLKNITIGRNLGARIEVTAGVGVTDEIVSTPLDTLEDGEAVQVATGPTQGSD